MNLWLNEVLIDLLNEETEYHFPNETGGILMGFISSNDYVITHIIGPGPNAIHEKGRFIPDHEFQCREIEKHYKTTSGIETYLGDWHSHPNSSAYLSRQDKKTLKNIADFAEARIAHPVMMVLGTKPKKMKCWRYIHKNKLELQTIQIYK